VTIPEIKTVCFVGAGTMGCFNAIAAALSGYDVVLFDVDQSTLELAPQRQADMAAMLVGGGDCSENDVPAALQRVSRVADLRQATASADLVSESVFERLDVKRETHRQLDAVCPPRTILTTNSSNLLVSRIEDVVARGDRFAAMHSHLGAPLVDIVGGPRTSATTIDLLERYVLSTGGVPLVLKKEYPGYVLNAILGPVLGSALALAVCGIATPEDVDRAWMSGRGAAMGPFGMIDLFGINLIRDAWQYRQESPATADLRSRILALLQPMVDRGELGVKSGRGFYQYPGPRFQQPDFLSAHADLDAIDSTLVAALIGNAVLVAANGVAEPADIDRAWKTGTYLDRGPFGILAQLGAEDFIRVLDGQVAAGFFDIGKAALVKDYLRESPSTFDKE